MSYNRLVLFVLLAHCLPESHVVDGLGMLGVLSLLVDKAVSSSLCHGLGEGSDVLPWDAGQVDGGLLGLLYGEVWCKSCP